MDINPRRMAETIGDLMSEVATPEQVEANKAAAEAGRDPRSYEAALERQRNRKQVPASPGPSIMQLLAAKLDPEPVTDLPCEECGAPAGRSCEAWCIADQALPPDE